MKKILIGTNNKNKVFEIKQLLKDIDIEFLTLSDINLNINIIEDQSTFESNAKKKAFEIGKLSEISCICDDSGIEIPALNNWPGIYTNRLNKDSIGDTMSAKERNEYILNKCVDLKGVNRKVIWKTSIAFYSHITKKATVTTGILEGTLTYEEIGENGFGFDSIFLLNNGKTLAQLSEKEKNDIGSRKKALLNLKKLLNNF